jgi:HSP20 family molecular chaperone IbpA
VEATSKDGILTIKLAKPEEVKPRKIEVKVV